MRFVLGAMFHYHAGLRVTRNIDLVRQLGRGAMGEVWVARHRALGTDVAVKLIAEGMEDHADYARERFAREARAAAGIKSPHVVQLFDAGVTDFGAPYIVMELLEGDNLAVHLDRHGPMSPRQAEGVVRQVADALAIAHASGIVHRDIKPENIFIDRDEDGLFVKLLDFGIAKHTLARLKLTGIGELLGTLQYMSREQVMNAAEVDHRADLWSLAVVAYEMLIGEVPFWGPSVAATCAAVTESRPRPVSARRFDLPRRLDGWFERAFHPDIARRFASARELADSFRAIVELDCAYDGDRGSLPPRSGSTCIGLARRDSQAPIEEPPAPRVSFPSLGEAGEVDRDTPLSFQDTLPALPRGRRPPIAAVLFAAAATTITAWWTVQPDPRPPRIDGGLATSVLEAAVAVERGVRPAPPTIAPASATPEVPPCDAGHRAGGSGCE